MSNDDVNADVRDTVTINEGEVTCTKSVVLSYKTKQPRKKCVGCGKKIPRDSQNDYCSNCYDSSIF